jgi:hypothetical protein
MMRRRLAVAAARMARTGRGRWPDRNPLRRILDRVEGIAVAGSVAFLAGAPLAAVAAWHAAGNYGLRDVHVQQAAWHQVPAVLVTSVSTLGKGHQALAQVRWLLGRRLAAWDAEWRATGPQWTRRR